MIPVDAAGKSDVESPGSSLRVIASDAGSSVFSVDVLNESVAKLPVDAMRSDVLNESVAQISSDSIPADEPSPEPIPSACTVAF